MNIYQANLKIDKFVPLPASKAVPISPKNCNEMVDPAVKLTITEFLNVLSDITGFIIDGVFGAPFINNLEPSNKAAVFVML